MPLLCRARRLYGCSPRGIAMPELMRGVRGQTHARTHRKRGGRAALLGQAVGTRGAGRRKWRGADESGRGCCFASGNGRGLDRIARRGGAAYGIKGGVVGAVLGDDGWRGGIYAWRAMHSGRSEDKIFARGENFALLAAEWAARGAGAKICRREPERSLRHILYLYWGVSALSMSVIKTRRLRGNADASPALRGGRSYAQFRRAG